jgi:hypothetical protein
MSVMAVLASPFL